MKSLRYILCGLLLFMVGSMQAQSDFNPADPQEPQVPVFKYALTTSVSPAGAGSASGAGSYAPGTTRTISTSANSGYTFSHWTLNGERIDAARSFSYTTVEGQMDFVAVYTQDPFTPVNPSEPSMIVKSRLFLTSDPEGICTFNRTSGDYANADAYVPVNVTNVNQAYEFTGWYENGVKLTDVQSFQYLVGYSNATLEAHFRELPPVPFTPSDPSEPSTPSGQEVDIQTLMTGDANGDGSVDVTDAVAVINAYLSGSNDSIHEDVADVNHDGVIDITDAVAIINLYLNSQ